MPSKTDRLYHRFQALLRMPRPAPARRRTHLQRTKTATIDRSRGERKPTLQCVGQVVGQMNRPKKAGQVVQDMVTEYADVLTRFADEASALTGD